MVSGRIVACGMLAGALLMTRALGEPVVTPKVVTDQSVDCSSIESIVKGVVKPGMTDREKALAIYHWYRRVVCHHRYMGADRRDVLRMINSYGFQLCGSQAAVVRLLLNAAGVKARVISGSGGSELGHTVIEAWWDDKWHVFDTMTSFYVLTRDKQPDLASMQDLKEDVTLVTKAVEEGRCGPEFLYCMKQTEVPFEKRKAMQALGMEKDIAWTLLVIKPDKDGTPRSIQTFWEKGPRRSSAKSPEEAYGGRYEPGLLDITLKPNEAYVRLWDNVGKWIKQGTFDIVGPYHTCGGVDEKDPINFKYYEPYKKELVGFAKYAYRYFGNGWLDWQPKGDEILLGATATNLTHDKATGVLVVEDPNKPASLIIPVKSPYGVVEAALDLDVKVVGPQTEITVTYTVGRKPIKKTLKPARGPIQLVFDQGSRHDSNRAVFDYELRIDIKGGRAAFNVKRLKTTFMLNMYALPYFVPGENTVTVSAETPKQLKDAKLLVRYEWDEGRDWKVGRNHTAEVTSFPHSYTVEVAGPKMPRMRRLVMKVVPNK